MEDLSDMKTFNRGLPTSLPVPTVEDDSEISIFDAQKYYFREGEQSPAVGGQHYEFHISPTVAWSEASWSSQMELLLNSPPETINGVLNMRTIASEKRNVPSSSRNRKWFFGLIRRMIMICRCWGKKTIDYQNPKKDKVTSDPSSHSGLNGRNLGSDSSKRQTDIQKVFRKTEMRSLESQCHSLRYGPDRHEHDHDLIPSPPIDSQYLPSSTQGQFSTHTHRVLASETTGFSFPILIPSSSARNPIPLPIPVEEPPRDSLEMYLPSDLLCINSGKSADTIPTPRIFAPNPAAHDRRRSFTLSASPNSRRGAAGEDDVAASDVSSDLFEIEIFTTQSKTHTKANIVTNNPMCHRRDFPDESPATPSFAPTECYDCEPSEASIRWSVTTAEGFDRGSIPNFSVSASYKVNDDVTLMRRALQRLGNGGFDDDDDDDSGESGRRQENGIMVTCRCGLHR